MADEKTKYSDAKILDWWRDFDINEYITIIETNGEWRVVSTKVEAP